MEVLQTFPDGGKIVKVLSIKFYIPPGETVVQPIPEPIRQQMEAQQDSGTTAPAKNNLLIYGIAAIAIFLILKK